jgi:tape measure domain-containing protein
MNLDALLRIKANVQGENNIRRLGNSLQGLEGKAKNAAMALSGLRAGVGGLIGLVGGGVIVGKIFGDTATLQSQAKSLEVLTGSAKLAAQIVRELQSYGAATPFESTELIETAKRLNAFGVGATEVVATTKRLGDVAGATGANLGELATAYGQVVAKGRLQGEELLQFQERGVALSQELQKMYKLQGAEFTKALEGGRISAEAVEVAIERLTDKGGKYADGAIAQSDTLNGKLSTLKDTITALSQTIGTVLEPALKGILNFATNILDTINQAIRAAINGPQQAEAIASVRAGKLPFGGPAAIDRLIGEQRRRQLQQQSGPGFLGFGFNTENFIKLLQQQPEFRATQPSSRALSTVPALLPSRANSAEAEAKKAAAEAKRAAAEQERLEERRRDLGQQALDLQEQLRRSVEDVNAAYAGVGLTPVGELQQQRNDAITENNRQVDDLTRKVVQLVRDVNAAGGEIDVKPFEELINTLSASNVALADKEYLQGLKDLLPSLDEYDAKIKEVSRGKTELTELEKLNAQINLLQLDILAATNPALAEQIRLLREKAKALDDATAKQEKNNNSFGTKFKQQLQDAYKAATDLGTQLGGFVVSGIDGLTNAIVEFAATGKAAFKEFAASALKELGAIFVKYALFKALFGIFPGLSIGMAATGGATGPDSSAPLKKFATGGVMSNNVVPMRRYASGGIARSPEMAIYGERGPEAYVPLPDGRSIPVKLRTDALNRYRPAGAMGGVAADGGEGSDGMSAPRGSGSISVRYESTVINNVEYVTAEQFRAGIQRAATEGAQRGTQNTLKRLQQSPATRRKVGI